ncbi:MAG: hypothetical protein HYS86_01470 [Candidatus Chisholmbacteria bacterium]|nr:hypothetical protein [Candidatus Chisholmbacteria bacterium]
MAERISSSNSNGLTLVTTYFVLFAVNLLVLYFAHLWFPQAVVLGTEYLTLGWSLLHSMGTLALIGTFSIPFLHRYEESRGRPLTSKDWLLAYLIINFVGLWLISRFSEQFGLGVTSWVVVAVLALTLDIVQGAAMMQLEKSRPK